MPSLKTQHCAASLLQRNITSWRRRASEEARPGPRVTVRLLMSSLATHLLGPGPHLPPAALKAPLPLLLPLPPHLQGADSCKRQDNRGFRLQQLNTVSRVKPKPEFPPGKRQCGGACRDFSTQRHSSVLPHIRDPRAVALSAGWNGGLFCRKGKGPCLGGGLLPRIRLVSHPVRVKQVYVSQQQCAAQRG